MGSQNQKMVNNIHLNRRGFKGDDLACFFKLIQHLQIKQMIERGSLSHNINLLMNNRIVGFRAAPPPKSPPRKPNQLISEILMSLAYGFNDRRTDGNVAKLRFWQNIPPAPAPCRLLLHTTPKIFSEISWKALPCPMNSRNLNLTPKL